MLQRYFEFVGVPFWLKNSPSSFQTLIDIVLDDAHYKYASAYMDNEFVFLSTIAEYPVHLRNVLDHTKRAGFTIINKKMQLATSKVDFLGIVFDNGSFVLATRN